MQQPTHHRMYYVAIVCPPEVDDKILAMKQWIRNRFGCTVALRSPGHITLIPPVWIHEEKEAALTDAVSSFDVRARNVIVSLNGFSHFGKRTLFVQVETNPLLEELKLAAEAHFIARIGDPVKADDRPFHPHITIANRDIRPVDFDKAWEHFSGKPFSASFPVHTISLLRLFPGKWKVIAGLS